MENHSHREAFLQKSNNTNSKTQVAAKIRHFVDEEKGKDDINQQADAFINNFHNHLRIQLQDSFKRSDRLGTY